jgi:hypothetical protein
MTSPTNSTLLHLLDVYGADQSRWPTDAVRQLQGVTDTESARAALREAKAFDQVLSRASMVSVERQAALADRIMAKVNDEIGRGNNAELADSAGRGVARGSNVIALPLRAVRPAHARPPAGPASVNPTLWLRRSVDWRAAAALAAALVLGIGVGVSGGATTTFQAVAETVGVSLDRSVLAFNDDHGGAMAALDDEDVL